MMFRPELAKLILKGAKSMTRTPVTAGEKVCRYKPGKSYALQTGRRTAGRITVLEVRRERLGAISLPDARREGFRTTTEFKEDWRQAYGSFDEAMEVWVISFAKGALTDEPRLLAARPGGPGGDYTTNPSRAVRGEGEAVSARVQEQLTTRARTGEAMDYRLRRDQLLALVAEIRVIAAAEKSSEACDKLRGIERQLRALDRAMLAA